MMVAKVRSRSSDKAGLGILLGQRKGASRGTSWKRGAGEAYPTPPVKTLTHESDGTWVGTLEVSRAKFTSEHNTIG